MASLKDQFLEVSDALGLGNPAIIEKDYWLVYLLSSLESLSLQSHFLIFAGGTALAKSNVDILRMSEDVDIKLIPKSEFTQLSRAEKRKARKESISRIEGVITACPSFTLINKKKRDESRYTELELQYPQEFNQVPCLRPIIKLELMETILLDKVEMRPIQSLVAKMYKLPNEVATFQCESIAATLVEKVLAMLRRTACAIRHPDERKDDIALVRHIYDVHFICQTISFNESLLYQLFQTVVEEDIKRFGSQHPEFVEAPREELLFALSELELREDYRERFNNFVAPMVFNQAPHDFDTCFNSFKKIALKLISDL